MSEKKTHKNLSPKQVKFGLYYYLPNSPTFGNLAKSARRAGFSANYAKKISTMGLKWIDELAQEMGVEVSKSGLVEKSKEILKKSLEGEDLKLAQDTAKFILKTTPEFSEKQELTTKGEIKIATLEFVNGEAEN